MSDTKARMYEIIYRQGEWSRPPIWPPAYRRWKQRARAELHRLSDLRCDEVAAEHDQIDAINAGFDPKPILDACGYVLDLGSGLPDIADVAVDAPSLTVDDDPSGWRKVSFSFWIAPHGEPVEVGDTTRMYGRPGTIEW